MTFPDLQFCTALPSFEILDPITQLSDVLCSKCSNPTQIYFTEISPNCNNAGQWQGDLTLDGYLYCEHCQEIVVDKTTLPFQPLPVLPIKPDYKPRWAKIAKRR